MNIQLNGDAYTVEGDDATILSLLKREDVKNPEMVSVQLNGKFVNSESLGTTTIREDDEIDYLYFMSGGQA